MKNIFLILILAKQGKFSGIYVDLRIITNNKEIQWDLRSYGRGYKGESLLGSWAVQFA
jgi:hypothetical protein